MRRSQLRARRGWNPWISEACWKGPDAEDDSDAESVAVSVQTVATVNTVTGVAPVTCVSGLRARWTVVHRSTFCTLQVLSCNRRTKMFMDVVHSQALNFVWLCQIVQS